jgi:ribokinase
MPFDVLGLGAATTDLLLYVDRFPGPDVKTRVNRRVMQCGGLTATALVAAARLGARCAYAGVLGADPDSAFIRNSMESEGIDLAHAIVDPEARAIASIIIVASRTGTRNIFPGSSPLAGAHPTLPDAGVIRSARVLLVDQIGFAGMLRASGIAREAGIPVVSDIERVESPDARALLARVNHPVMSEEAAMSMTGCGNPADAARALCVDGVAAGVVTCGEGGAFYCEPGGNPRHQPAFRVDVVDTTGCGDVFHGAYCAFLAEGLPLSERVRLASAVAAIKATAPGGQAGSPARKALNDFVS